MAAVVARLLFAPQITRIWYLFAVE